jgi:hypothetical protein
MTGASLSGWRVIASSACAEAPWRGSPWAGSGPAAGLDDGGASSTGALDVGAIDEDDDSDDDGSQVPPADDGTDPPPVDDLGPAGTCGADAGGGGIVQVTLDGAERWYYLGVPAAPGPLPVVVAFHGDEGHPDEAVRWFWESVWQAHGDFILVMTKCPGCSSWYQGDTDAKADYVWDVLDDVAARHDVDVSRIYAIGYSGGSSFLAMYGLQFQEVFAGIQWHCGGGWTSYVPPPRPGCEVDGRFVIATDDFLWDNAKAMESLLVEHGHEVEFVTAACSGHC